MTSPEPRTLTRLATWLALAFAGSLMVALLTTAFVSGEPSEAIIGLPGALWLSLPVACAAGLVGASITRTGAAAFLVVEMGLVLSLPALIYAYRGEGAIIGLAFFPLVQTVAILIVFLIALLFGWRMRPDFLKD
jgi:hypothetical protein